VNNQTLYNVISGLQHGQKLALTCCYREARGLALLVMCLAPLPALSAELYAGDGMDLRWDNTVRYSTAMRLSPQNAALLAYGNADDGDRDFAAGIVSNRFDLLSQLDLSLDDFGLHASAAGWYDSVYNARNDDRSQTTYNAVATSAGHFAPAASAIEGRYAELDDAFLYGNFSIAQMPVSLRLGRQTVTWGETLFYDANSIASAQAPTDHTRLPDINDGYTNDTYLPLTQISATVQILPEISLSLYDQVEARPSREVADGGYLSYTDFLGAGAGSLFLPSGKYLLHSQDSRASAGGQYGVALHTMLDDLDLGLYALRYNSRDPQIVINPAVSSVPQDEGTYHLVYPKGIVLYGLSGSTSLLGSTLASEISIRHNTPLVPHSDQPFADAGSSGYIAYLKGDLLHVQTSDTVTVGPGVLWDSVDLAAELVADDVTHVPPAANPAPTAWDRFAIKGRLSLQPHYFQVLPDLDITLPIGLGYNFSGHSFSYYTQNAGAGDFQVGVTALYRSVWKAGLMLQGFIGAPDNQPLADRDFIGLSVERTF
jgi:Protein of unknown function (DUF1302)